MRPYRAVCFDLGGVLIQIHHSWEGALHAVGVGATNPVGPLGGFPEFDEYQNGDIGLDQYATALGDYLGVGSDDAVRVHMAILRDEYPGVTSLVRELHSEGVVCGCLSNTSAMHWTTFFDGVRYGFGPLLGVRIGSHIERASKPSPAVYEAFEAASLVSPQEIVYFDDGAANVAAALGRGWQAHAIDPLADTAAQMRYVLSRP